MTGSVDYTHVATAPGRVNLIGEHIDYAGLSVLPIALQRHVSLRYRALADASVHIANSNPRFAPRSFSLRSTIEPYPSGDWGNYVKAAAQGLVAHYGPLRGLDALVQPDLLVAGGLSSSSALVVATALALLERNSIQADELELAELLANAERYVGVRGGGMDQAICLCARPQTASRVDFNPLALTHVSVPPDWRFIVASSLVQANKSKQARAAYNQRTEECRQALSTVTRALNTSHPVGSYKTLLTHVSSKEIEAVADRELQDVLRKRFRHVVSEAGRVSRAEEAMRAGDRVKFGMLMRQSHDSLRNDFDVSCPELDELVSIATTAGAAGARLTGAGFGGCIVALCEAYEAEDIVRILTNEFYAARGLQANLRDELFVAYPSGGATVQKL